MKHLVLPPLEEMMTCTAIVIDSEMLSVRGWGSARIAYGSKGEQEWIPEKIAWEVRSKKIGNVITFAGAITKKHGSVWIVTAMVGHWQFIGEAEQ